MSNQPSIEGLPTTVSTSLDFLELVVGPGLDLQGLKTSAKIDVNDLVGECASQAHVYSCACEMLCRNKDLFRRAKALYEVTRAQKEIAVRKSPKEFLSCDKVTETTISAYLDQEPELQEIQNSMLDVQAHVEAAQSLVDIFDMKRSMLNNEVQLVVSQYYQASHATQQGVEDFEKQVISKRGDANV